MDLIYLTCACLLRYSDRLRRPVLEASSRLHAAAAEASPPFYYAAPPCGGVPCNSRPVDYITAYATVPLGRVTHLRRRARRLLHFTPTPSSFFNQCPSPADPQGRPRREDPVTWPLLPLRSHPFLRRPRDSSQRDTCPLRLSHTFTIIYCT